MPMEIGSFTHVGMVREINEDSFMVGDNFAIIADGMGGHRKGEIASQIAVEVFSETLSGFNSDNYEIPMRGAIDAANSKIFKLAEANSEMFGMGTTVIACVWNDKEIYVANVGDSRCYLIRNNEIKQISVDHSYVQQLLSQGKITYEEAKKRRDRNLITRAVGCEEETETDIFKIKRENDDIIVLCSDGLSNMIDDSIIKNNLLKKGTMQSKVEKLVKLANKNGGGDNVTLVALKFEKEEESE